MLSIIRLCSRLIGWLIDLFIYALINRLIVRWIDCLLAWLVWILFFRQRRRKCRFKPRSRRLRRKLRWKRRRMRMISSLIRRMFLVRAFFQSCFLLFFLHLPRCICSWRHFDPHCLIWHYLGEKKNTGYRFPPTYRREYVEAQWYEWWEKSGFFAPEYMEKLHPEVKGLWICSSSFLRGLKITSNLLYFLSFYLFCSKCVVSRRMTHHFHFSNLITDWLIDWLIDWLLRNLGCVSCVYFFSTSNWFNRIICPRKICDGHSSAECDWDTSSRPRTYQFCGGCLGSVTFFKTIFRTFETIRSVYCHWMLSLQLAPNVWSARPLGARLRSRRHSDAGCGGKATG